MERIPRESVGVFLAGVAMLFAGLLTSVVWTHQTLPDGEASSRVTVVDSGPRAGGQSTWRRQEGALPVPPSTNR